MSVVNTSHDDWRAKAMWDDDDIERLLHEEEEDGKAYAEWFGNLTPEEKAREYASMDAYVQEVEDERRRQEAWHRERERLRAERALRGLRNDGAPDRRFKRSRA